MLILHLHNQHPIWTLVDVLIAPFPIQLPVHGLGKQWRLAQVLGTLQLTWKTRKKLLAPSFREAISGCCIHFVSEPVDEDLSVSPFLYKICPSNKNKILKQKRVPCNQ